MSIQTQVLDGNRLYGAVTYSDNNDPQTLTASLSDSSSMADADVTSGTKPLSDSETLTETIAKLVQRALADSSTITETRILSAIKALSDSTTLTDARNFAANRSLSDLISLSETWITQGTKLLAESASMTEAFAKAVYITFADNATMADARALSANKPFSDTVTMSDSEKMSANKTLTEAFTLTETFAKSVARAFADSTTVLESFRLEPNFTFGDGLTMSDSTLHTVKKVFSEINTSAMNLYARSLYGRPLYSASYTTIAIFMGDAITFEILRIFADSLSVTDSTVIIRQTKGFTDFMLLKSWLRMDLRRASGWTATSGSQVVESTLTLYDNTLYGAAKLYAATPKVTWTTGSTDVSVWQKATEIVSTQPLYARNLYGAVSYGTQSTVVWGKPSKAIEAWTNEDGTNNQEA